MQIIQDKNEIIGKSKENYLKAILVTNKKYISMLKVLGFKEKEINHMIILAVKESIKHFRGEGGCCGGGSSKPPKKRLKNKVIKTYIVQIEGMHCQNCANTVTRSINELDGATSKINLKKHEAKISCDREIDALNIKNAIERKGYKVTDIIDNKLVDTNLET